jgi:hypothetical protein
MVTPGDIRRIALALDGAVDESTPERIAYSVAGRGFAWTYLARLKPKGPRVPHADVLAVSCPLERKEMLVAAAPDIYFDDDHYRGYPAVLVRLPRIAKAEFKALLGDAHRLQAGKPAKRPRARKTARRAVTKAPRTRS